MVADITSLALGDRVRAPSLGKGVVIECTEKPSVRVEFDEAGKRWLTQKSIELLSVEKE